jgi:manganese-dependent inorganic pyrophosphatase
MTVNEYDPAGGHTKEEADAAYAELFKDLHGEDFEDEEASAGKAAVVGHRDPDTDSICSAIAYARLMNQIDPKCVYTPYRTGHINDETAFVLRFFKTAEPPLLEEEYSETLPAGGLKIILVDHNERAQMSGCINMADVIEIVDHHRLAGNDTPVPIRVRCEPCGAVCTMIYAIYIENGIVPGRNTAGLLCASIVSDTMLFKAPETTRKDRLAGAELAAIAGLDLQEFSAEMFKAGCVNVL